MTNDLLYQARKAELRGDWREAHILWLRAGRQDDASACLMIINAVAKGDRFRSLVEEKLQIAGLPSSAEMPACIALDNILREAHQEVYCGDTNPN